MPVKEKDMWIFENNRLETEGIKSTLAELQRFEKSPDGVDPETAAMLSKTALDKAHNYVPGDVVEVCHG